MCQSGVKYLPAAVFFSEVAYTNPTNHVELVQSRHRYHLMVM